MHGSTTPISILRVAVTEKDNVQNDVQALLNDMAEDAYQEKKKGSMLIFDFDQTIVKSSMCNLFASQNYNDYNSGQNNAVTKEKIEEFFQNSGIKNKKKLKSVLQSALSSGAEVVIVSLAYPKSVEHIVKNYLDLTEEQAQSIKVFKGTTKRQPPQIEDSAKIAEKMTKSQDPQIEKHLRVLYLLKAHKKDKGMLPQKVMLVDGNMRNTNPVDDFHRNIKELLKKNMKSLLENIDQGIAEVDISKEELENITFKGINISSKLTTETDRTANDGYLDEVEKWIKEPIQNHQDIEDLGMVPTPPPSYTSEDGSEKSLISDGKKTNRFLQKVKYVICRRKKLQCLFQVLLRRVVLRQSPRVCNKGDLLDSLAA